MAHRVNVNNKNQVPVIPGLELSESTIADVLQAHKNNQRQAIETLKSISTSLEKDKENKIRELQEQFTVLPREIIIKTLESVNWDVDAAIIPLFSRFEDHQTKEVEKVLETELAKPVGTENSQMNSQETVPTQESPFSQSIAQKEKSSDESTKIQIIAEPSVVDCGATIKVQWELTKGTTSNRDWIGFFKVDQPNKNYVTYEWRGNVDNKGTLSFTAPNVFGNYELRYIPYGSYQHIAVSNPISVGPQIDLRATLENSTKQIRVEWTEKSSMSAYPNPWIGLYEKSQTSPKSYLKFEYAMKPYTQVAFPQPIKPGVYEFRYYARGYDMVAVSNPVVIDGKDEMVATVTGSNTVEAKISIVTVDPYYDHVWVGLYSTSESDHKKLKRYQYISQRECVVSFRAPEAGEYEFRLFAHKSYDLLLKSNSINVQ